MALGGFLMMMTMPMSGVLSGKMDPRYLLVFGYASVSLGLYYMATHLTPGHGFRNGGDVADLPGGGACVHFHSVERALLRGGPARKEQSGR